MIVGVWPPKDIVSSSMRWVSGEGREEREKRPLGGRRRRRGGFAALVQYVQQLWYVGRVGLIWKLKKMQGRNSRLTAELACTNVTSVLRNSAPLAINFKPSRFLFTLMQCYTHILHKFDDTSNPRLFGLLLASTILPWSSCYLPTWAFL